MTQVQNILSTKIDDFLLEEYDAKPCFEVDLSDGTTIYSDDCRPGLEESSTWLRLRKYIKETNLDIVGYRIRFRSNVQHIAYNADGYFFSYAALFSFGSESAVNYYCGGYLKDGRLIVKRFQLPDLSKVLEEERDWKEAKECLIINPSIMKAYQQNQQII